MRKRTLGIGIALAALISLSLAAPAVAGTAGAAGAARHSVQADTSGPVIVPPQPPPFGTTYGHWDASWWQWLYQTPTDISPEFSLPGTPAAPVAVDCTAGQSGQVWFLGGTFLPTNNKPKGARADVYRTCSIPTETYLFFPVLNAEYDNLYCPNSDYTADELTNAAKLAIDDIVPGSMNVTIDGVPVSGLDNGNSIYRAPSPWFSYKLPADNIGTLNGCNANFPKNTMPPRVDNHPGATADGIYLMLAPLSPGVHVIHFGGEIKITAKENPAPPSAPVDFIQNINYTITVGSS